MRKSLFAFILMLALSTGTVLAKTTGKPNPCASGKKVLKAAAFKFNAIPAKIYGQADFELATSGGAGSATFTSDNTAVATIVSGKVHIVSAGTANIAGTDGTTVISQPLTVVKAVITISAVSKTKAYGANVPALTIGYAGFKNSDTQTNTFSTLPTVSSTATKQSAAGTYPITATGAAASNYNITYVDGTLTITAIALTITPVASSRIYGSADPAFTYTATGFVNGDTQASLTTQPAITSTTTTTTTVGSYVTTAIGAKNINYSISYATGTLTIAPAILTVTGTDKTKLYGATLPALAATYSGFVNGESTSVVTTKATVTSTGTTTSAVGSYPITASGAGATNYLFVYVNGTLSVTPATLTITAISTSKVYGAALPAFTFKYAGYKNGDTQGAITTRPVVSTSATSSSVAGNYIITPTGAVAANYVFNYTGGVLTVIPANLTITPATSQSVYGSGLSALSANYTGLVNGDTNASFTVAPTLTTTATATLPVGTYTSTASGAVDSNYTITYSPGSYKITAAPLVITADNKLKVAGQVNPVLSVSYSGFVNGDNSGVLTKQPTITTTAVTGSPAGSYPITPKGATAVNYSITYTAGTLTITANNAPSGAPVISYNGGLPYVFNEGTLPSITPTNTGGAVPTDGSLLVTTVAGSNAGYVDGANASAKFRLGSGGVTEFNGIVYVADQTNYVIRKIVNGVTSTLAGSGTAGFVNGVGTAASFNLMTGIVCDASGNIYVCDKGNNVVRMITPDGSVSTYAGTGAVGYTDGTLETATFGNLVNISINRANGVIYALDAGNAAIRRVYTTQDAVSTVTTNPVFANEQFITIYGNGSSLFTTGSNNLVTVTRISGRVVSTYAGNGTVGAANGNGTNATFNSPSGIFADPNTGILYVSDGGNNLIRSIDLAQNVTTFAGNGSKTEYNGEASVASLNAPGPIFFDNSILYVGDTGGNTIRETGISGYRFSSLYPNSIPLGLGGNIDGTVTGTATGVTTTTINVTAFNAAGSSTTTLMLKIVNSLDTAGTPKIYTIAGNNVKGSTGNGGQATSASLNAPYASVIDKSGNIYVASYGDFTIRKINATTKIITLFAGTPGVAGFSGDGGQATSATLNIGLTALAVDSSGNVFLSDYYNNRIRKIATNGIITTYAGSGNDTTAYQGDGVVAASANIYSPEGLAFDSKGNLYFGDNNNTVIRKIAAVGKKITTVAGGGGIYSGGAGLDPLSVGFNFVERLAIIGGNLYIPDESNEIVYKLDILKNTISSIAGTASTYGNGGDGGPATSATFEAPIDITGDSEGNLYIADQAASVIRKIDAATQNISTFAGTGAPVYTGDGGAAEIAGLNFLSDLKTDKNGYLIVTDLSNQAIRRIGGVANTQTITFPNASVTYGLGDFAPNATASSGLPLTFSSSNTSVATIGSSAVIHIVTAGIDSITAVQPGNANFQPATAKAKLTIAKYPLTITANNATKVAGTLNPALTFVYGPFVYGDTTISTPPKAKTTAVTSSPAGSYPITLTGAVSANYALTYVAGTLTVTAGPGPNNSFADNTAEPNVKTALSPNGDGTNDVLAIDNISKYPNNKITIVNSSGTKVFEATGYDNATKTFDGHSNITGAKQKAGTYYYVLQYVNRDGVLKSKSGYIALKY